METFETRAAFIKLCSELAATSELAPRAKLVAKFISENASPHDAYVKGVIEDTESKAQIQLMLAIERRFIGGLILPFLRVVQFAIEPEELRGQQIGTGFITMIECIALLQGRSVLVECVNNDRWRDGYFEPRVLDQGEVGVKKYTKVPGQDRNYYRLCNEHKRLVKV